MELNFNEQKIEASSQANTDIESIIGVFRQVTAIPTVPPVGFWDSIAEDTSTGAIYYYDYTNNSWRTAGGVSLAQMLVAANTIQTYTPSNGGTATLNLALGNIHHITMPAGNITIAISNGTAGQCFIIRILQDSVGGRTVTWFTTIRWVGGSAPSLTTGASKADTLGFEITGTNTYDGFIVGQNI